MGALTILLIRHGEKPNEAWPGPGTNPDGADDRESLVIRGWQRAGAWAALFGGALGGDDYPRPGTVYAASPAGPQTDAGRAAAEAATAAGKDTGISQRPYETALPLAAKVMAAGGPATPFGVFEEPALAETLKALDGGVALVCWEHKAICKRLLPSLLADGVDGAVPKKWDKTRFDVVFRLDRAGAGERWSFRQLCPCLLSGDSGAPMPLDADDGD